MRKKLLNLPICTFLLALIIQEIFGHISLLLLGLLDGECWFFVNSVQRFLFGVLSLFLFVKLFNKESWKDVFKLKGFRKGMIAATGILLVLLYNIVYIIVATAYFDGLTVGLIISRLLCQQIATGFFEEMFYRGILIECYFQIGKQNVSRRLLYATSSSVLFGLGHVVSAVSFEQGLFRFIVTGILGFAFAAIYLYSHNLLVPMLLHVVYDIPANILSSYVEWNHSPAQIALDSVFNLLFLLVFIISLIFVIKSPDKPKPYTIET